MLRLGLTFRRVQKPMMDEGDPGTAPRRRRRRRSGSKSKPEPQGIDRFIRSPLFGRLVFAAMAALALAYVWHGYRGAERATRQLGPVALGQSESQVRQQLAGTLASPVDSQSVAFRRDGRILVLRFDPSRKVAAIGCHEEGVAPFACPDILGVRIGDHREALMARLGEGQVHDAGGHERVEYPALGARFELVDGKVSAIGLGERAGGSLWPVALWRLLP